jgi:hypothetical protein
MLGHLVYTGHGDDGATRIGHMGWLRRVLNALFGRH